MAQRLRILHVVNSVSETSMPYNEFCLPRVGEQDIALCTYFSPRTEVVPGIRVYSADGSMAKFLEALRVSFSSFKPHIIHIHQVQVGAVLAAIRWVCRTPIPTLFHVHNAFRRYLGKKRWMLAACLSFTHVVFCSRSAFDSLPRVWKRLIRCKSLVVQNGVNIDRIDRVLNNPSSSPFVASQGEIHAVSIGRLIPQKNQSVLMKAVAACPNLKISLHILGDGYQKQYLASLAQDLGVTCHFYGILPRDQVFRFLNHADLFISAARWEGLPIAVLEAMACRCLPILSDIPPHQEIAERLLFVSLVNPDDSDSFAQSIQEMATLSVYEREIRRNHCRRVAEEDFSLGRMHQEYDRIYSKLIVQSNR